jgi:hypothetical protein
LRWLRMPHEHNNHRNLKRPMTLRNQTPQIKIAGTLFRPAANNKSKLNAPRSNHNEKSPGTRRGSFMQRSKTDDSIVQPILAGAVSPASFLRSNRQNRALIQCRVNVGGAPSNLRIVSGGIPTLPAISSGVGSRPITCRMFRQVRTILFKASMVAIGKWPSIIIPPSLPQIWPDPPRSASVGALRRLRRSQDTCGSGIGPPSGEGSRRRFFLQRDSALRDECRRTWQDNVGLRSIPVGSHSSLEAEAGADAVAKGRSINLDRACRVRDREAAVSERRARISERRDGAR